MLGTAVVALGTAETGTAQSAQGDALPSAVHGFKLPDSLQSLNDVYPGLQFPVRTAEVSAEFRPRAPAPWQQTADAAGSDASKSLQSTNAWQRLRDFRSRVGVRVLTLWESRSSTVSLQAGKRGGPSLQWSSRVMGHGDEASRGLLDRLFASNTGASSDQRLSQRSQQSHPLPSRQEVTAQPKVRDRHGGD